MIMANNGISVKTWRKPIVTDLGSVSELTKGGAGSGKDRTQRGGKPGPINP
jgi:hypothetical protein